MFDIKKIRDNPRDFDTNLAKRGLNPNSELLIKIDEENRTAIANAQSLQEERNSKSKLIGEYASSGNVDEANKLKEEVSSLKSKLHDLENKQKEIAERLKLELSILPNLPDEDVPIGDEEGKQEIKAVGEKKE